MRGRFESLRTTSSTLKHIASSAHLLPPPNPPLIGGQIGRLAPFHARERRPSSCLILFSQTVSPRPRVKKGKSQGRSLRSSGPGPRDRFWRFVLSLIHALVRELDGFGLTGPRLPRWQNVRMTKSPSAVGVTTRSPKHSSRLGSVEADQVLAGSIDGPWNVPK